MPDDATSEVDSFAEPQRYLTAGEDAARLGVSSAALSKNPSLPAPDALVGRTRGWLESTIEPYVRGQA